MAIAFGSVSTGAFASTDGTAWTITLTKPASLAAGDMMVAVIGVTEAEAGEAVSGWTKIGNISQGTNLALIVYAKTADAGDVAASNFTFVPRTGNGSTNDYICGSLLRLTGTSPIASATYFGTGTDEDKGATHTYAGTNFPVPIPVADSVLVVATLGIEIDVVGVTTVSNYAIATDNPTWTERFDTNINDTTDFVFAVATAPRAAITSTGNLTMDYATTGYRSAGILLAVIEQVNVTVSPAVIVMGNSVATMIQAPAVTGDANVSPAVITAASAVQAPTVTVANAKWSNTSKSSAPSWANTAKS